ncbi:unnamed protein product [Microthlaspi erraticum]|uniref:DUF4283 domain-containing protein n=1 Tax=Microthlaspi erraticum TaxID=1685480 RepID=A0A6D2J3R4_9BRAS|nr:unnamed protein product [Microthlaspi erraticum]
MWKPKGAMYVMDLPRHFFMIRFELEDEYMETLTGGPWKAFGSYLMVQVWSPCFDPLKSEIETTPDWVRLSNIPVNFYHKAILMGIAKGIGTPVKVDDTTLNFERARFARICVEVNLKKPLKGTVVINGERYFVSYEGLSTICSLCGMYGHLVYTCSKRVQETRNVVETRVTARQTSATETGPVEDGFTQVRRGRRQQVAESNQRGMGEMGEMERNLNKESGTPNILLENRFGNLEANMEDGEIGEVNAAKEGSENISPDGNGNLAEAVDGLTNKENLDSKLGQKGMKSVVQGAEVVFGANLGRNPQTNEKAHKGRKAGNGKSVVIRPKRSNIGRPTQGLVFGSVTGTSESSPSGKRLRVEQTSPGRSEGFAVVESNVAERNESVGHSGVVSMEESHVETNIESPLGGTEIASLSSGLLVETTARNGA